MFAHVWEDLQFAFRNTIFLDQQRKMSKEIEIKFRAADLRGLGRKLRAAEFRRTTPRTHETNTLYDLPGEVLRGRKELLRIRKYGSALRLNQKSKRKGGRQRKSVE